VKKLSSSMLSILLLLSMVIVAFKAQPISASGTVYIRADGHVEGTAYILTADNVDYVFSANINVTSIVVERSNIVIDGAGYMLQGPGVQEYEARGIWLSRKSNVTIKNMSIRAFYYGIWLYNSSRNNIFRINATDNFHGIVFESSSYDNVTASSISNNDLGVFLLSSSNDIISENDVSGNADGIFLEHSQDNIFWGNNATSNKDYGIYLWNSDKNVFCGNSVEDNNYGLLLTLGSSENYIYHNNFINNTFQVHDQSIESQSMSPSMNIWENDYRGNYWSDYNGTDHDNNGIGDTQYTIDKNNNDRYPLMSPASGQFIPPETQTEEVPLWMIWWFWVIIAVIIVGAVISIALLKRRKPQLMSVKESTLAAREKTET